MIYKYGGILCSLKTNESSVTHYNKDEPQGQCAKWNKIDTKGEILWDSIHTKYIKWPIIKTM